MSKDWVTGTLPTYQVRLFRRGRDLGQINVRRGGTVPVVQRLAREVLEICRIGGGEHHVSGLGHAGGEKWQQYLEALHGDGEDTDWEDTDL